MRTLGIFTFERDSVSLQITHVVIEKNNDKITLTPDEWKQLIRASHRDSDVCIVDNGKSKYDFDKCYSWTIPNNAIGKTYIAKEDKPIFSV